jgi:hypothetical protein
MVRHWCLPCERPKNGAGTAGPTSQVRLSDGPMVPGARTLVGVHYAGVTVFDKRKVPSVVHTYNEVVGWQHDRTRVLISLEEEDGTAAQLYLQALPEVRRELALPLSGSLAFS